MAGMWVMSRNVELNRSRRFPPPEGARYVVERRIDIVQGHVLIFALDMEPCPADVQRGVQGLDFTEVQPVLDAMLVRGRTVGCPAPGIHLGGLRPQGCMLRPVRAVGHVAACGIEYGVGSRGRHGVLVIVLPDELRRKASSCRWDSWKKVAKPFILLMRKDRPASHFVERAGRRSGLAVFFTTSVVINPKRSFVSVPYLDRLALSK